MGLFNREHEFETGMDEQAKQAAMNALSQGVDEQTKRDDRSEDYFETLRLERLHQKIKAESLEMAERELALTERRNRENERALTTANREYSTHLANLAAGEHYRHGYDKLQNLEPAEAKAMSEVLTGYDMQALRGAIDVAIAEAFKRYAESK